jgi:hypothetical protein
MLVMLYADAYQACHHLRYVMLLPGHQTPSSALRLIGASLYVEERCRLFDAGKYLKRVLVLIFEFIWEAWCSSSYSVFMSGHQLLLSIAAKHRDITIVRRAV